MIVVDKSMGGWVGAQALDGFFFSVMFGKTLYLVQRTAVACYAGGVTLLLQDITHQVLPWGSEKGFTFFIAFPFVAV